MNKTEESLVRLKRESTKIRNEREDITNNLTEIKRTLSKYYKWPYANKLDNFIKTNS